MINLNNLLDRFKKSLGKDVLSKESVIFCIEEITRVKLDVEDINIKEGILEINSSPGKKNEIRLKEEKIIATLRKERGININKIFYK